MAPVCVVCNKSSQPKVFLITCVACSVSWHHRCHKPPIPDPELIAIIKRYNEARKHNHKATLDWSCGPCRQSHLKSIYVSDKHSSKDNPIVIVSDSDDIVTVPKKPGSTTQSQKTTLKFTGKAVQIIDDPIDYPVRPSPNPQQSSSASANVLTSSIGHLSVSGHHLRDPKHASSGLPDNDEESDGLEYATPKPSSPGTKKGWSAGSRTSSFAPIAEERPRIPDMHSTPHSRLNHSPRPPSLIEPTGSNTALDVPLRPAESNSALNPDLLSQFRAKIIASTVEPPGTNQPPTPEPQFHPALLPHYINSRYHNITCEGDIWHLAALRKFKFKRAINKDREPSASASHNSGSFSSMRKVLHGTNRSLSMSVEPFFFSVDAWMKEKEAALALYEFE